MKTTLIIIETTDKCCCNCKGDGELCDTGGAWIYCETRSDNDESFDGDCGETKGCYLFKRRPSLNKKSLAM